MSKATHQNGDYRSLLERELSIHGIPTAVVDPHHHVLPFWHEQITHLKQREQGRAHLLHIDAHSDMWRESADHASSLRRVESIVDYTRKKLTIADFIWAADYFELLHSIFWFDPRKKPVIKFKDRTDAHYIRAMVNKSDAGWSYGDLNQLFGVSDHTGYEFDVSREYTKKRLNADTYPIILDIDLDAFECVQLIGEPHEKNLPRRTYQRRLEATFAFLVGIRSPSLITIARSQHPMPFVPVGRVFDIEADVLRKLEEIYGERTITTPTTPHISALPACPYASNGQLSLPL